MTRFSTAERERFLASLETARSLACFVDDELVGTLLSQTVGLTVPGPVVIEASAVSEVAVLPTHRRQGNLSAMMRRYLEEEHDRGTAVAVLAASEGAIYRRFGFGPATWACRYTVERAGSRFGTAAAEKGSVRLLSAEEARSCAPSVFDEARALGVGEVERLEGYWEDLFESALAEGPSGGYAACYEEAGRVDGYVLYAVVPAPGEGREREILLSELVATTPACYRALWSYVLGIDLVVRVRTEERPVDEPLRFLLADPRALRTVEMLDGNWVRLLDVAAALSSRRYRGAAELVIDLVDEWCPWNSGRLELCVDADGRAQVTSSTKEPSLRLGVAELAACYLGGTSVSSLVVAGSVLESRPGAALVADALFASWPAPYCSSVL